MTEDQVKKEESEKIIRELSQAYKRFAETPDGKIIIDDLEKACGQMKSSATRASNFNPYETQFHEGMRNMYLYIMRKVNLKERE
jgi:hypothetical protein